MIMLERFNLFLRARRGDYRVTTMQKGRREYAGHSCPHCKAWPSGPGARLFQEIGAKRLLPVGDRRNLLLGEQNFGAHSYGVRTGGRNGQWTQILCTQDAAYGGWDGAGNAFYEPWTQADGTLPINLPKWSVVIFRRK